MVRVARVHWRKLLSLEKGYAKKITNTIFNARENETMQILQHSALKPKIFSLRRIPQPINQGQECLVRISKMAALPRNEWRCIQHLRVRKRWQYIPGQFFTWLFSGLEYWIRNTYLGTCRDRRHKHLSNLTCFFFWSVVAYQHLPVLRAVTKSVTWASSGMCDAGLENAWT